jgi:antirestriction protein
MTHTVKFYAACLASYNNGQLHGVWIDAASDLEEMQGAVQGMLKVSPQPQAEEWLIHDYDDDLKAISGLGETLDLKAIADIMEAVEEIEDDYDDNVLALLIEWVSDKVAEPCNWASHLSDAFMGIHADAEDYASHLTGDLSDVPEHIRNYIDFKEMARDLALGDMDFICTSTGSYIQDYDSMRGRGVIAFQNH